MAGRGGQREGRQTYPLFICLPSTVVGGAQQIQPQKDHEDRWGYTGGQGAEATGEPL